MPLDIAIAQIEPETAAFRTHYDAFKYLKVLTTDLGMTAFLVLSLPSVDIVEIGAAKILTNWPREMIEHYDRYNLLIDSPVIRRLLGSTTPFTYDVEAINAEREDGKRSVVVELFQRHRMEKGAYFPVHDAAGGRGAVSFSGGRILAVHELAKLLYIVTFVYNRISQLSLVEQNRAVPLGQVEIDCLQLTAAGKSGRQIGALLGMSESAVSSMIVSIIKKLGCNNRTQAVVTALRLGLIRA